MHGTQGSLRTRTAGERVTCPVCQTPVTLKHLVWECQYHEQELPASWTQDIRANENAMLWSRGLIEAPVCRLVVGLDSLETHGMFAHGWPVRVTPSQRLAIGVKATCTEVRLRHFVVSLIVGVWQDGSWQLTGKCTLVVPGEATEARAWFYGCWLLLQATLGRRQVNVAHRAGWAAVTKGAKGTCAPDLWHSLPAEEWKRLKVVHVPKKMLKQAGGDNRAWLQYQEAALCAQLRAQSIAPDDMVQQLHADDQWHQEVYEVAAQRISHILTDKEHYMHGKLEPVPTPFRVKVDRPKGRLEILRQLTQQAPQEGHHHWALQGHGIRCKQCGLHIKGCSTHDEIARKQATVCTGVAVRTLTQLKLELVEATEALNESQAGHRWYSRTSSFGCSRCWRKVSGRSSKEAVLKLSESPCDYGPLDLPTMELRTKVNPEHILWKRGEWLECQRCHRVTKVLHGRGQSWLAGSCDGRSRQTTLRFGPSSES